MIKGKNGAKFKGPSDTKRRLQSADEVKGTQKPTVGSAAAAIDTAVKDANPDNNSEEAVTQAQLASTFADKAAAKAANPTGTALATALVKPAPSIKDQLLSYRGLSKGVAVGSKDYSQMTRMGSGNPRGISFNLPGLQKNQFIGAGGELFADRGKALDSRMAARVAEARNELKQVSIMGPRWQRYGETNSFDPRSILQNAGHAADQDPANELWQHQRGDNRGRNNRIIPGIPPVTPDVPTTKTSLAGGGITVGNYQDPFGS